MKLTRREIGALAAIGAACRIYRGARRRRSDHGGG